MLPLVSPLLQSTPLSNALPRLDHFLFSAASTSLLGDPSGDDLPSLLEQPGTFLLRPETILPPLNEASESWVRALVWTDFRIAVAFFVVVPLVLLSWAIVERVPSSGDDNGVDSRSPVAETVLRYMTSYWQASSLLLLTVALNIQESNLGVFAGLFAQAMIVVGLWWWDDLNEELALAEGNLCRAFVTWRWIASVAAVVGVGIQAPFQSCNGSPAPLSTDAWCAPWLEPPRFAASVIGLEASPTLQSLAVAGCTLYALVLVYYAAILLPTVGRSGRAERPAIMDVATPIGAWQRLGFLDPQNK